MALNDPILTPLLDTQDARLRELALEVILVEHVRPVVARVLAQYQAPALPRDEAEDLAATINLRVVRRLQEIASDHPIERLDDYVATVAYNVVYGFLRRRFPERTRLKNRLRYLFGHDDRLAMWESGGEIICGLARWRGRMPVRSTIARGDATSAMLDRESPGRALIALFEREKAPLRLDDVVRLAADLWRISDVATGDSRREPASEWRSPAAELETREYIAALWREVRQLRDQQRAALLLNLRDVKGTNGVALLLLCGVATFEEIADAVGLNPEQLAEIWNDLPLDDNTIASTLHISRQQVINLRKAARERLERRMAGFDRPKP